MEFHVLPPMVRSLVGSWLSAVVVKIRWVEVAAMIEVEGMREEVMVEKGDVEGIRVVGTNELEGQRSEMRDWRETKATKCRD